MQAIKRSLGFVCTILFHRLYLKSVWVFGVGFLFLFFFVCESFYLFFFSPFSSDYLFRTGKQCMNEWLKLLREEEDCTVKFLFWKKLLKLLCMHWKSWHRQWTLMYFSQIWECWMRYSFCPLFLSFISLSWTKQYKTWISFLTTESERIDSQMYNKQNIIPC